MLPLHRLTGTLVCNTEPMDRAEFNVDRCNMLALVGQKQHICPNVKYLGLLYPTPFIHQA